MPSHRFAALGVALLLVLAGCSGGGPTSPSATDGSTADTPTGSSTATDSPTATPTPEPGSFPAGTDADGIEDVSALVGAHVDALSGVAHRVEATRLANRSDALRRPVDATVHVGGPDSGNATYVDQRANASQYGVVPHESFRRGSTLLRRSPSDDGPRYAYRHDTAPDAILHDASARPLSVLQSALRLGDFEFAQRTTADGRTLFRFEADAPAEGKAERFEGTVLVSPRGVVHRAAGSYVVDPDREPAYRVEFSYELEPDVGPLDVPAWVEEVPRPVVERVEGGAVLAIENRGDAALPAGTELGVLLPDREDPIEGRNLSLPARLGPGETVYAYVVRTDDGPEVRLSADRPTATGEFVDLSDRDVYVGHESDRLWLRVHHPPANATDGSE